MKVVKKDMKHGVVLLEVTSLDDLWYLSQIIDPSDVVKTKTTRKVKVGSDASSVVKKTYVLEVDVERVEFSTESLRVLGRVVSEVEDIPKGSYHTLTIDVGSLVTIQKKQWLSFQVERLDDACRDAARVLLVAVDRGDAAFGVLRDFGVEVLSEVSGSVPKKLMSESIRDDFFEEIAKEIVALDVRLQPEFIVVGSPAFWKDELLVRIQKVNAAIAKKVVLATTGVSGRSGLQELVTRDEVRQVLQKERVVREAKIVEEVFAEIQKDGPVAYGISEVERVIFAGAVKMLVVTEELLRNSREDGSFARLEEVLKAVDSMKGEVMIVSVEHDAGKQLAGIGGIAALLRYKI